MVGSPPAWRTRSTTAWMVVPLSQTSSTTRTRWPRRSGSAGNWRKVGCGPGLAVLVVVLDRRHEDVPDAQLVGEHAAGHEAAAGDDQHHVVLATDLLGEARDQLREVIPGDVVLVGGHAAQGTAEGCAADTG